MHNYIVCEKRGNQPRIHVKICRHRCEQYETCEAYQDNIQARQSHEAAGQLEATALSVHGAGQTAISLES